MKNTWLNTKRRKYLYSALGLLFCLISLVGWINIKKTTGAEIDPCIGIRTQAIGNRLSQYFYLTNVKSSDRKLKREKSCNAKTKNQELKELYDKLDWHHQSVIFDYKSDPEAEWNQLRNDGTRKPNYLNYWQTVRPQIRAFYEKNIKAPENTDPVIHFRCSDIPFLKHYHYHLTKENTVKWMIEEIKNRGYSKVVFLNCNKHGSLDVKNSCANYVEFYLNLFRAGGLEVETRCDSIYQDFAMMVHSPLLISLNASSFAFMAGIAKDPQDYIACNMGIETNGEYFEQTDADWLLSPFAPLLHKDVEDYHNSADVIEKLSKV